MKHFDLSDWTDFARGVAAEQARSAMEAHLVSGCPRCQATLNLLKGVVASTRTDAQSEPPESAVRWVKAFTALQSPRKSRLARLVARLVYDSAREPLPVGLRGQDRVSRHTVHEAGDFSLDLRLEQEKGSAVATLVGQLTNRKDPDSPLMEAPVLLMGRKSVVAHAVYNRFGEFQMDCPPAPDLRLCVALTSPSARIELSLNRLMTEPASEQPQRRKKFANSPIKF